MPAAALLPCAVQTDTVGVIKIVKKRNKNSRKSVDSKMKEGAAAVVDSSQAVVDTVDFLSKHEFYTCATLVEVLKEVGLEIKGAKIDLVKGAVQQSASFNFLVAFGKEVSRLLR